MFESVLGLIVGLLVIAVLGHGLWLLLAWIVRLLFVVSRNRSGGPEAELDDLAATARQLARFRHQNSLDAETYDRILQAVRARKQHLHPADAGLERPTYSLSPEEELIRIAKISDDVAGLPVERRRRALSIARGLTEAELEHLPGHVQLLVARLHKEAHQPRFALRRYQQLLRSHPSDDDTGAWALEAGRFAAAVNHDVLAGEFLEIAIQVIKDPEQRAVVLALLHDLQKPKLEEEIPLALAADEAEKASVSSERAAPAPAVVPEPRPPRRSLGEILATFMEERNIFWGELAGGLLMVGCSIALVLYFWQHLKNIPYFEFFIFVSTTAITFGAGLYAKHRLRLDTTGRGLLVIAALLIPLNFVVMAGQASEEAGLTGSGIAFRLGAEIFAMAVLAALLWPASSTLVPEHRWQLIVAVLGISVSQLAMPRLLARGQMDWFPLLAAGGMPVLLFAASVAAAAFRYREKVPTESLSEKGSDPLPSPADLHQTEPKTRDSAGGQTPFRTDSESQALGLAVFLGLAAFPLVVALAFLVSRCESPLQFLQRLAVLFPIVGSPAIVLGQCMQRSGGAGKDVPASGTEWGFPLAGTIATLAGLGVMVLAVGFAWPAPAILALVSAMVAAGTSAIGIRYRLPVAHALAQACLALGCLVGYQLATGHIQAEGQYTSSQLIANLTGAQSALVLIPLVLMAAAAWEICNRHDREPEARCYLAGSGSLAALSLCLAFYHGSEQRTLAAVVAGSYALCFLGLGLWRRLSLLTLAGLLLFLAATFWSLWAVQDHIAWYWGFVFALEALILATVPLWSRASIAGWRAWRDASALAVTLALLFGFLALPGPVVSVLTGYIAAVVLCLLAGQYRRPALTRASCLLATACTWYLLSRWFPSLPVEKVHLPALLAHASLFFGAGYIIRALQERLPEAKRQAALQYYAGPFTEFGLTAGILVGPLVVLSAPWLSFTEATIYLAWLAALWLVIACLEQQPILFSASQLAWIAAVVVGVTAWLNHQDWVFSSGWEVYSDGRCLQTAGIALVALCAVFALGRAGLSSTGKLASLFDPGWPAVDRLLLGLLVTLQLALGLAGVVPGISAELTQEQILDFLPPVPQLRLPGYDMVAWIWLIEILCVLGIATRTARREAAVLGLASAGTTAALLGAVLFENQLAMATAVRWGLAIYFLLGSCLIWFRRSWVASLREYGWFRHENPHMAAWARRILMAYCFWPVAGLTSISLMLWYSGQVPAGPAPASPFTQMGWVLSTMAPMGLLAMVLIGHALREDSAAHAFLAGLVVDGVVTAGLALHLTVTGTPIGAAGVVLLIQIQAITASLWALACLGSRNWANIWQSQRSDRRHVHFLMSSQLVIAAIPYAALLITAGAELVASVPHAVGWLGAVGTKAGWAAIALPAVAMLWYWGECRPSTRLHCLAGGGLAAGIAAACTAVVMSEVDGWLAYHLLMVCWLGLAVAILGVGYATKSPTSVFAEFTGLSTTFAWLKAGAASCRVWINALSFLLVALAIRSAWDDPEQPYWSAGSAVALSILAGVMAWIHRRRTYVYQSGLLLNLAALFVWIAWGDGTAGSLAYAFVIGLAFSAGAWLLVEPEAEAAAGRWRSILMLPRFGHVAALFAATLLTWMVLNGIISRLTSGPGGFDSLAWLAWASVTITFFVAIWDRRAIFAAAGLYMSGLLAVGIGFQQLALDRHALAWYAGAGLAVQALLASQIYWGWDRVKSWRQAILLPGETASAIGWFVPCQAAVAAVALMLSLWIATDLPASLHRLAGPGIVLLLALAAAMLAGSMPGRLAVGSRHVALGLISLLLIELGWAVLGRETPTVWMYRNLIVMCVAALLTFACGSGLARWGRVVGRWAETAAAFSRFLGIIAGVALLVVLTQELQYFDRTPGVSRTPMHPAAIGIVFVALIGMMAAGVTFAVVPGKDPLGLSDRGRRLYVYGVEIVLGLMFVHARLTLPELFLGRLGRYWPLIIMAVAFIGIGLSEVLFRRALPVIAEPLRRTSIFLPILPLAAFWFRPPEAMYDAVQSGLPGVRVMVEYFYRLEHRYDQYSFLWILAGGLYALVAASRHSFRFALIGALSANFALWSLLHHNQVSVLLHPQMWLIPVALIGLTAEYLSRERMPDAQAAALRYASLLMIYVSSTADMFLVGLDNSMVWPAVLALLSVCGLLLGIVLQVRAFLYSGITFLLVVILSMIWHAAVGHGQIWVWWLSGIILGAAIFALFAVFEKRRMEVLHVVESIRRWR